MRTALLEKLVCPDTCEPLEATVSQLEGDDVRAGTLSTVASDPYPILDGIPRFVPQESGASQTEQSFAQKWEAHGYYRKETEAFYTKWYLERYGFDSLESLGKHLGKARFMLDAGTGAGRDAANFARITDATVFAVDITATALKSAARTVIHPNVAFLQADINHLPFPAEFFDFISCDQVIHHTADPPAAFKRLAEKLRPGGEICVYVYRKKAAVREFVDDHVRAQIKDMPLEEAMKVCEAFTQIGQALSDLDANITIDRDINVLGIKAGTYDLQRFFHYNIFKCFWNDSFDFFTNNVVNVDWYHPENCFRYEPDEFRTWFDSGWDIQHFDKQEAGLSCRARKR